MIDLSVLKDFPKFPYPGEFCVPIIEYKGIVIKEGMWAVWGDEPPFRIQAVRLNPTLRFWDGKSWALAVKCKLIHDQRIQRPHKANSGKTNLPRKSGS